jgi:thioredoxin 1
MRILKFQAGWCIPCKNLSRMMEEITITPLVEVIDIDENNEAAMEYGIRSIPTLIMLDDHNNIVKRIGGVMTKQQLEEWVTV